jgi:hypothetical protein
MADVIILWLIYDMRTDRSLVLSGFEACIAVMSVGVAVGPLIENT